MTRTIRDAVDRLNRLIHVERATVDAYKGAMAHLDDSARLGELASFAGDHRRHIDELALLVRNLGGEPAAHGDLRHGGARSGLVAGAPEGAAGALDLVEALRRCEAQVLVSYEEAVSQPGVPVDVRALLERHLDDERSHHAGLPQTRPRRA